jgi:serine/threonine-protein kinase
MSQLKKLMHEIHRRSLWQVLGIYVVAGWLVLQAVDTLAGALNLPEWAPRLALFLLIIFLPIVLATAFVQGGMAPREQAAPAEDEAVVEGEPVRHHRWLNWRNALLGVVGAFALLGVATAVWLVLGLGPREGSAEAKGIAVLPFDNMSPDPENEFFADGIHDEIIAQLAKIATLRVISRTSVHQYQNTEKTTPMIARELGVANLLQGSVRRAGDRVRIIVQLIKAETDDHLWTATYEEKLATERLFAIQSDVAQQIARALRAELLPDELERIEAVPTENRAAYDLYLQGNLLQLSLEEELRRAEDLYLRALALDPEFAHAWASLSEVHSGLYFRGYDQTEGRLLKAREAVERALEIDRDLAEAHRALGTLYYWGYRDYERATESYDRAERGLPGDVELLLWRAAIAKRQGRFEEAIAINLRASELAPKNGDPLSELGIIHLFQRQYRRAEEYFDLALDLRPDDVNDVLRRAAIPLWRDGDTGPLRAVLTTYPPSDDPSGVVSYWRWTLEVSDRRFDSALEVLHATEREEWEEEAWWYPKSLLEGLTHRYAGNGEAATAALESARSVLEPLNTERPEDPRFHSSLGIAYAGLGRANDAIRHGLRAQELLPRTRDALDGSQYVLGLSRIYAMVGQPEAAVELLDRYLSGPGRWSLEGLLRDPRMDALRDHPALEVLVAKWGRQ